MKVKHIFYKFYDRVLISGNKTSFSGDTWNHRTPLCERFPMLYDSSFNKGIKVHRVVRSFGSCLVFRRTSWGDLAKDWFDL
jgi:hypothetical protein